MAVTGWLREVSGLEGEPGYRSIKSDPYQAPDRARMLYFREYLAVHFADKFRRGQGTEELLDLLQRCGPRRRWLDLGAGTTTLFWALALNDVAEIVAADIVPEALMVLQEFSKKRQAPLCYEQVLGMLNRPGGHFAQMCRSLCDFVVIDMFKKWPSTLGWKSRFDLITTFGVLALGGSANAYDVAIQNISTSLSKGGEFVGAHWIRSDELNAREPLDSKYLDKEFINSMMTRHGFRPKSISEIPIQGDRMYKSVIAWSAVKNADIL